MTHKQHPLGSGFLPSATADDVLAGADLSGQNVIVTGGHAGIGLEVSKALAKAGAAVLGGARQPASARAALGGLLGVTVDQLDLVDPASIDAFAGRWLDTGKPLHVLVNNAGASGGPQRDARGYDTQFAINHLGHFQLTRALLPALRAADGARVVNVSSGAHRFGRIRWDDPNFTTDFNPLAAYAQSKTANVLFAIGLDERWAADGIRGYAVHPGVVAGTKLNSAAGPEALRRMGLIDEAAPARSCSPPRARCSRRLGAFTSPTTTSRRSTMPMRRSPTVRYRPTRHPTPSIGRRPIASGRCRKTWWMLQKSSQLKQPGFPKTKADQDRTVRCV